VPFYVNFSRQPAKQKMSVVILLVVVVVVSVNRELTFNTVQCIIVVMVFVGSNELFFRSTI